MYHDTCWKKAADYASFVGMQTTIRPATKGDIPQILEMVRELAVFENLEPALVATVEDYEASLFGSNRAAEALIAELSDGTPVGYAIFFTTFSTFIGRPGIWLEDIYVRQEYRGNGSGKLLLKEVAKIARDRNAGRYEWCVLDWNQNAIDFYDRAGAEILDEWRIVRMEGEGIEKLAEG
ncbi:MAG: GNAT family N-acetyltransferase [Verrucomicrobiales bacterium]|nr:GNAT family N-acetyltransferase [Verrucomicrobiales bacterium]